MLVTLLFCTARVADTTKGGIRWEIRGSCDTEVREHQGVRAIIEWKWVDALTRQLELCGVAGGEAVVILTDAGTDPEVSEAARLAAERTGADVVVMCAPGTNASSTVELTENPVISGAVREAALLLDLSSIGVHNDAALDELLDGGLRVVSAGQVSKADLGWFTPHAGLDVRLNATIDSLRSAKTLDLATHSDHELQIVLSEFSVSGDSAVAVDDGDLARWPGGTVRVTPGDETVSGSVVLMPGDINSTAHSFVRSPVVLVIESDHVCDILGSGADADLIRAQFESFNTPTAYGIGALMIGLNRPARPDAGFDNALLSPHRSLLTAGHVTLRFGSNVIAGREISGNLDFTLRAGSLRTDQQSLVDHGALASSLAPDIYEQASYR